MSKTTKPATSRTNQLSYQEFVVRHERELHSALPSGFTARSLPL
jgi:hypothetical protein